MLYSTIKQQNLMNADNNEKLNVKIKAIVGDIFDDIKVISLGQT